MQEAITMKITMKELENILLNYYKGIFNNENIRLTYSFDKVYDFYKNVKFEIIKPEKIGAFNSQFKYPLSGREIVDVLNSELSKSGYKTGQLIYKIVDDVIEQVTFEVTKKKNKTKMKGMK